MSSSMADIEAATAAIMIHPRLREVLTDELCPANWKGTWQDAYQTLKSCTAFAESAALPSQERPPQAWGFCHGPEYNDQYYCKEHDEDCVAGSCVFGKGTVWWNDVSARLVPPKPGRYALCFRYGAFYSAQAWNISVTCPKVGSKGGDLVSERTWRPRDGQQMRWYVIPDIEIAPECVGQAVQFRMWDHGSGHSGEKWDCAILVPMELLDLSVGRANKTVVVIGDEGNEEEGEEESGDDEDDY